MVQSQKKNMSELFVAHVASLEAAVALFKASQSQRTFTEMITTGGLVLAVGVVAAAVLLGVSVSLLGGVKASYEALKRVRKLPKTPLGTLATLEGKEVAVEGILNTERPLSIPNPNGGASVPALAHLWVESLVYKTSTVVSVPAGRKGPPNLANCPAIPPTNYGTATRPNQRHLRPPPAVYRRERARGDQVAH